MHPSEHQTAEFRHALLDPERTTAYDEFVPLRSFGQRVKASETEPLHKQDMPHSSFDRTQPSVIARLGPIGSINFFQSWEGARHVVRLAG